MKDYSQHGEQSIILEFFAGRTGTFLDVGAHAVADNSNTRALMELGWSGVCVEPSPTVFPQLLANTEPFPLVQCVNAAVDMVRGLMPFYASPGGDQIGTTQIEHRNKWAVQGHPFTRMFYVSTLKFESLEGLHMRYNFLSIDTEGTNLRVLHSAPLNRMGVELVCVERVDVTTDQTDAMQGHLKDIGYEVIAKTAGNLLAARRV